MTTIHVYNRSAVMRRAWKIAREEREKRARMAFDLDVRIVGSRIIHTKAYEAFLAETPFGHRVSDEIRLGGSQTGRRPTRARRFDRNASS